MSIKEVYLLKSSPTFQLLPREEGNIDLELERAFVPLTERISVGVCFLTKVNGQIIKDRFWLNYLLEKSMLKHRKHPILFNTGKKTEMILKMKRKQVMIKVRLAIRINGRVIKESFGFQIPNVKKDRNPGKAKIEFRIRSIAFAKEKLVIRAELNVNRRIMKKSLEIKI